MAAASPRRIITDELLAVMVRIRREAGVGHAAIQAAIDKFACPQQFEERTGGIGFPLVEDIPQEKRGEFMAALAELSPDDKSDKGPDRKVSVVDIWPSRGC
jgi:hypothetical protein